MLVLPSRFVFHSFAAFLILNFGIKVANGTLLSKADLSNSLSSGSLSTPRACILSSNGSNLVQNSGPTAPSPLSSGQASGALSCEYLPDPTNSPEYGGSQASSFASTKNATAISLQSPTPTAAGTLKYKDPKLTGCYAGTGGSTSFTLTSGDLLGTPTGYVYIKDKPQSFNFSCSDFFKLGNLPWHLKLDFAESPSCASYNQDLLAAQKSHRNPYADIPPGVINGDAHIPFNCCGGCKLVAPEVQLLYWSTPSSSECVQANATITSQGNSLRWSTPQESRASSRPKIESFAVIDGSTLTFPSLYIAILGAVSVTDRCRTWGQAYHNPTIGLPPGDLSTLSFHGTDVVFDGFAPETGVFDPAACRTYGLSNGSTYSYQAYDYSVTPSTLHWVTTASYTMGPPYNPILFPPKQLTALDPEWQACTSWDAYGDNAYDVIFGLYDPPRVLSPTTVMVDASPTPPSPPPRQSPPSPQPADPILPVIPAVTASPNAVADANPSKGDPTSTVNPDTGLAGFILRPFAPDAPNSGNSNSPKDPNANVNIISLQNVENSQPTITIDGNSYTANEASQYIIGSQTLSPGGPIIYVHGTAYSLAVPVTACSTPAPPSINGEVILPGPSGGIIIAGQTIARGGQTTIQGKVISVGSSNLAIDGSIYALPSPATSLPSGPTGSFSNGGPAEQPTLTINGHIYTANPAHQYMISSQTLNPGSPPITLNNIPYALPPSPTALISNGHTIPLNPNPTSTPQSLSALNAAGSSGDESPRTYTIDGISLIGDGSALVVGTATLTLGSSPLTVSGHVFSMATGGKLVVDGRTSMLASVARSSGVGEATGASSSGNQSSVLAFTGDASCVRGVGNWVWMFGLVVLVWGLVFVA